MKLRIHKNGNAIHVGLIDSDGDYFQTLLTVWPTHNDGEGVVYLHPHYIKDESVSLDMGQGRIYGKKIPVDTNMKLHSDLETL